MTLKDGLVSKTYKILDVRGGDSEKRRLLDMGFTPSSRITILGIAPSGGTILVNLRNFTVALREDAAQLISIEV